jgi:ankyrin repeat protein
MNRARLLIPALLAMAGFSVVVSAAEIHEAVKAGDLPRVRAVVAKDPAQLNAKDDGGRTPLHWAARGSSLEVLAYLVEKGADPNVKDNLGSAPLHSVASAGNTEGVKLLLSTGADVDCKTADQRTSLHLTALGGHVPTVRLLVEKKADLESRNDYGRTPLVLAAREMAGLDVIRTLLDLGARVDATDRYGDSALTLAAWRGSADVVSLLLARNAPVPVAGRQGRNLLQSSVSKALPDLFARMIEKGADLPTEAEEGSTLLHAAAQGGSTAITESLLARGMNVNASDRHGWTPLHFAVDLGRTAEIELLLARGADLKARTVMGQSAYNIAEDNSDKDILALLASKGAAPDPPAFPVLTGEYLGQKKPGRRAEEFAPGIVSGRYGVHSSVVFSPDGKEAFWSLMLPARTVAYGHDRTVVSRLVDGRWSYPREAIFDGTKVEDVPFFQPGTGVLFDMARRPFPGGQSTDKENIWVWQKGPAGWTKPRPLPAAVNDVPQHWQFSLDRVGNVYFSTTIAGSLGGSDVYVCRLVDGHYLQPENLGPAINSAAGDEFPFILPDGGTLLFGRSMDIYVSFRDPTGQWTKARKLGPGINTPDMEVLPAVSADGKYLFFSRGYAIYWIDAGIINDQRTIELSRVGKKSAVEEVGQLLGQDDVDRAKARFAAMRGSEAGAYFIDEAELNALGYDLLRQGKKQEAIAAFEMNCAAYPESWNTWDSLAEAFLVAGDEAKAEEQYGRSVALNPNNENGKNNLSSLRGHALDRQGETKEVAAFKPGQNTGLHGPYFGQSPPGVAPKVFAPGIVSTAGGFEFSQTFTPDGRELYFTRRLQPDGENEILVCRLEHDGWTAPQVASFSVGFPSNEPFITPDGARLFFGSNRPPSPGAAPSYGIFVVERTPTGWSEPHFHGPGMYVSTARSGNLYLTDVTNIAGGGAIVFQWVQGQLGPPRRVSGSVNTPKPADHSFVAPDESYVLFDSYFRPGGQGGEGDLWVSFRKPGGSWSEALNLGDAVNTPATNFCPAVSPDGKYIFFSTNRDIYWVSAQVLEGLRAKALSSTAGAPAPVKPSGQ